MEKDHVLSALKERYLVIMALQNVKLAQKDTLLMGLETLFVLSVAQDFIKYCLQFFLSKTNQNKYIG